MVGNGRSRIRIARGPTTAAGLVALVALVAAQLALAAPAAAAVTSVRGTACGYQTNVGLFGGPLTLRGCGQAAGAPATAASPSVSLPGDGTGSGAPVEAVDADGATAQYGPARIFSGLWPAHVASAPPSGPITVRTQGTPGGGSVTSSVDIVLRQPANPDSPGGFGPSPVEGQELHSTCTATESSTTGSVRFVGGLLSTSTDAEGSPLDQEAIPDNPPPNYTRSGVITNVGDVFTVVFNQQIVNPDGSLTVNGVHMYLFGPVAVGEVIIGQVNCGTTPSPLSARDTLAPSCGFPVVVPVAPDDPTPRTPRTELIGVFDAGGLREIANIQATNATVTVGDPASAFPHLKFSPGQTGPLPVTAVRVDESQPMSWSFDAIDTAGNTTRSSQCPTLSTLGQGGGGGQPQTTTTTLQGGATPTTVAGAAPTTAVAVRGGRPGIGTGSPGGVSPAATGPVARTGSSTLPLALAAGGLLAGGALIVIATRRRRAARAEH